MMFEPEYWLYIGHPDNRFPVAEFDNRYRVEGDAELSYLVFDNDTCIGKYYTKSAAVAIAKKMAAKAKQIQNFPGVPTPSDLLKERFMASIADEEAWLELQDEEARQASATASWLIFEGEMNEFLRRIAQ
jgi:hypothetical protein